MINREIWLVDDDASIRFVLEKALSRANLSFRSFSSGQQVLNALDQDTPHLLVSDVRMPDLDGMSLLQQFKHQYPEVPVIIMTAHSDLDSAVAAFKQGAFEYLAKPFDLNEFVSLVERALEQSNAQRKRQKAPEKNTDIIGEAPAMQEVFRAIGRLSQSAISVLINGESGTGKELIAKALHKHSPRSDKPFIALNMAAIPSELIESELFGHEKGAFTGAQQARQGRFEQADGGTLFLDEIGDMPLPIQTRLLRVLADGEFYPVGSHRSRKVDVRIVAATHQDLEQAVAEGSFREDLFHRLNVIRIKLPALRERPEDIAKLCEHFLVKAAKELNIEQKQLSNEALNILQHYSWPGNVRQLENLCRSLTVLAASRTIVVSDLPYDVLHPKPKVSNTSSWQQEFQHFLLQQFKHGQNDVWSQLHAELEKQVIEIALEATHGHRQLAAQKIGWGRNTLTRKLKEYNLD